MPVGQRQPVVGDVSEIKQYNNTRVVSSLSTAIEIDSATQRNNVIPNVVLQDTLIDIEGAQAKPEFISGSPQPPIHPIHTTFLSQHGSSVTSSSATTSGLQNMPNPHVDKPLQTATYCQTYNTDTINSALSTAAKVMDYQYVHKSPTYTSHANIHTPQLHQPTPSLYQTPALSKEQTLDLSQYQLPHSDVHPHTLTHSWLPSSAATLSHSQTIPATQATYPWLINSSDMRPQRIQYVGPPIAMPAGHNVHLAYDPQDPFTLQHQVPPTSHTPARTLIEMHPPLPTPIIECGRPICTPVAYTSSFTDVTPHTASDTVCTTNHIAIPNDVTQPTTAKHTTHVTLTENVCSTNAPVMSVTPASVQLSTNTANMSTTTSQVATPTPVVVKQLTQPKSFNGTTSWKTYKEYYERVCAVNGWSTQQEKAQNLMLALEGSAAEVLKDVEDTSPSVYKDIWTQLARRFGMTDGPREAMRRFDNRRQQDSESVQEFEQSLRVLYRDAWPTAMVAQRDSALKRKFEDGLTNPEMNQFLRLHARNDDFPNTVLKVCRRI